MPEWQPRGDRIIVRRYTLPEMVGSLYLPDAYRADMTGTLWEFVRGGPDVAMDLGLELEEGDIIQTGEDAGVWVGDELWFIRTDQIESVHPWVSTGEDDE